MNSIYMKSIFTLVAAVVFCMSCEKKGIVERSDYSDTLSAPLPIGIYSGTLPCADCKGILYDVELDSNFQYVSTYQYLGKSDRVHTNKGQWIMLSDTIIKLDSKRKSDDRYFSIHKDALRSLDKNGRWIASKTEGPYLLRKQSVSDKMVLTKEAVLAGNWTLTELAGEKVKASDYADKFPSIEFAEGKVSGFSGCNRFSGSYTIAEKGSIQFGMMMSTKMACPAMNKETAFLKSLERCVSYTYTAGALSLLSKEGKVLAVFVPAN